MKPQKTNYLSDEQHLLSGALLNQRASRLNAKLGFSVDAGKLLQNCDGRTVVPPSLKLELFTITDAADTCANDALGYVKAPCDSQFLYRGTVKYFDGKDRRWKDRDEEYDLDSAATSQHYKAGDVVPVFWDKLRGTYIPMTAVTFADRRIPRYHGMLQTVTGIEVLQANNAHRTERDSLVEVYCQVIREDLDQDSDWQTIGKLSWRVPWLDTQRAWEETRSGFATFRAPKGTRLRFLTGGSWHPHPDDDNDKFQVYELEWMAFGIFPQDSENVTHDHDVGLIPEFDVDGNADILLPGRVIKPYLQISEVKGDGSTSPFWSHSAEIITQSYEDDGSEWITGIHFQATMRSSRTVVQRFPGGDFGNWFTRLTCNESLQITEKCRREFGFGGGPGSRIELATSSNIETCTDCSNPCGLCTWEWTQDPTTDGAGNPNPDDFWNNTEPCAEAGGQDCSCDEPTSDGDFYGQIIFTICTEPSSSSKSSTSSSSISTFSSTSTLSSVSTSSTVSSLSTSSTDSSLSSSSSISATSLSSSSVGCTAECVWTWTEGTPNFWDTGVPCDDDPLGPVLCTCDEPSSPGTFIGETAMTDCYEA